MIRPYVNALIVALFAMTIAACGQVDSISDAQQDGPQLSATSATPQSSSSQTTEQNSEERESNPQTLPAEDEPPVSDLNSNADLASINFSDIDLGNFSNDQTSYQIVVPYNVSNTQVLVRLDNENANFTINNQVFSSGEPITLNFAVGVNNFEIIATAEDGETQNHYVIEVTRQPLPSDNASLAGLAFNNIILDQNFSSSRNSYTSSAPNTVSSTQLTALLDDENASLTINGQPIVSGQAAVVGLNVGANTINIAITAEDGHTNNYSVSVTREEPPSNNTALNTLTFNNLILDQSFSSSRTSYTATVTDEVNDTRLTASLVDSNASLSINGQSANSGQPYLLNLTYGDNIVNVVTTAEDGVTRSTYSATITRETPPSDNADLSSLSLAGADISPAFANTITNYSATTPYATTSIEITMNLADTNATATLNGQGIINGQSTRVDLSVGSNIINLVTAAEDETTRRTYTIDLTREPAGENAELATLSFSEIALNPVFTTATTSYTGMVSNDISSTQLIARTTDDKATLTLNGRSVTSGQSVTVALDEGDNLVEAAVTAEDGTTIRTYRTTVTRLAPLSSNATLASLTYSGFTLDQGFTSNTFSYSATVANAVSSTDLTAILEDAAASLSVNGLAIASGQTTSVSLNVGINQVEVTVLAEDGVTENNYILTLTRESAPVSTAINMSFHVHQDRQKFLTLAAYSNDITYRQASFNDPVIDFGVRYKDAITSWDLQSLPSHGLLYEGYDLITSLPYSVSNPDDLLYVPDSGFVGNDGFTFSVQDSRSTSNVAAIDLIVESSATVPAGIAALPSIFYTPTPVPATSGDVETIDWYIDNSHPNATDEPRAGESDPRHGTPDTPRATIPPSGAEVVAGASVFIGGGLETPYNLRSGLSWHRWELLGTAAEPVYLLGMNRGPNKPMILGPDKVLRLEAQNTIIEGLNFRGMAITQRNDATGVQGDNIVVRHSILDRDFRGTSGAGATFNVGDTKVLYDVHVRNAGRTEPDLADENDVHGIQISNVSDYWILDSLIHNSAGDSIQINGEFAQGLYVGRNKLHSDNENAIDFKRRYDLVFVENDAWDYRAIEYGSSGSDGAAVIINQDTNGQTPTYSVIARNRIWDVNRAIRHQGNHIWTTDNVLWHVHHNVNTNSRAYAISVGNNADTDYYDHIVNNTFHMVDGGVWIWASPNHGTTDHRYTGNVFGTLNADSLERVHFSINSNHDHGTTLDYNYYAEPSVISWAGNRYSVSELQANIGQSRNSVDQIDPQFNNPALFDLRPKATSPLIDANVRHEAYQQLSDRYGVITPLDNGKSARPTGAFNWDIGAYER